MQITKKIVHREVIKYKKLLNLEVWDFTVKYDGTSENDYATVAADPAYLRAEIAFNLSNIKDIKTLRRKLIHELMHVVLSQYTQTAVVFAGGKKKILDELEERVVTEIERWELWGKVK